MATNIASLALAADPSLVDMDMREDWLLPAPTRYVILDIDCTFVNDRLEFSFRDPRKAKVLAAGLQGAIEEARMLPAGSGATRYSPLDIELVGDSIYIFYRIVGPANMTFSRTKKALRHKNLDDREYYGGLRHVPQTGDVSEGPIDNCKIVYFVADPLYPPVAQYAHGFSLNVQVLQTVTGGTDRLIEFEIDPDIRHPGGTQP